MLYIFEKSNEKKKVSKNLVSKDYTLLYESSLKIRLQSFLLSKMNTNKKLKIPSAPQEIHSFLRSRDSRLAAKCKSYKA